jgi:hypothetical protein
MKKNILTSFNLMLALFLYSCSNEQPTEELTSSIPEIVQTPNSSTSSTELKAPIIKSGSFKIGPYGGLGYGYNVTGEYANANSSGLQVIDIVKFAADFPSRFYEERPHSAEYSTANVEDASAFSNLLSRKLDITKDKNLFGKTLASNFSTTMTTNNKFDRKYIYASGITLIESNRFRVITTTDILKNYLTPEFLQSLDLKTPQQIVNDYGTHVMLDIYTGAKLDVFYQSETTNLDREHASNAGIQSAMRNIFNTSFSLNDPSLANENFNQRLSFKTIGGDPSKSLKGYLNLDQPNPKISISNWQSSVTNENSYLVDFGPQGLIYIYDLVSDPTKKAALKAYVDQYIIDNKVTLD